MSTEPHLLPLVEPIGARYQSLTVDSRLVNMVAEKGQQEKEMFVYRRPAFRVYQVVAAPGTARGLHNWNGVIYSVIEGTVYKGTVAIGSVSNSGTYSFTSTLGDFPVLFLQNGTNGYTISTSDIVTPVTDVNYPPAVVDGAAYLDGTVYLLSREGRIFGSDAAANDATVWDPLNLIVAQIEPKPAILIVKQLAYILAIKQDYTEAFYDAGNPVGSPLAPVQGAKMNFGCVDAKTVRDVGGDLLWLANSGEGFYCVVMVAGLKAEIVSTPSIERILSIAGSYASWNVRIMGHRLYAITDFSTNITLVFDLTSHIWYQWSTANGGALQFTFSCEGNGTDMLFLHRSNGTLYRLEATRNVDEGDGIFGCAVYTPNFDGGTRQEKTLPALDIVGDQVATTVSVAYSDDDYATWSPEFPADMSLDRPRIEGLGSFTKRAFRFFHQDDAPFRLRGVEMYLDSVSGKSS